MSDWLSLKKVNFILIRIKNKTYVTSYHKALNYRRKFNNLKINNVKIWKYEIIDWFKSKN